MLHRAGRLERHYTDLYAGKLRNGLVSLVPGADRFNALRRFRGRVAPDLPLDRVRHFPTLGMMYYLRRTLAGDTERMSAVHLWAGAEFGRKVAGAGFGGAGAVYTFNTAALEILRAAKERGLFTVLEQTIAPRQYEEELLAAEERRYPGWSAAPRRGGRFTLATVEREAREWQLADLITCGSAFVREGIGRCGGPVEKCVVVPYGVDETFAPVERAAHGGALRVVSVGEGGIRKGIPCVYELARRLQGEVEFRWVGSAGLTPEKTALVAAHVHLVGTVPRNQILDHYAWADVFLLPSVCEGSATVIYEALQTGLPVITTPNAGSLVEDGKTGFVVEAHDVAAMQERLQQLRNDPALLADMSRAARQCRNLVSLEAYQGRLLRVLNVSEQGRPAP
jgi:glycosyltransferase involved in cell wall biosynthesis